MSSISRLGLMVGTIAFGMAISSALAAPASKKSIARPKFTPTQLRGQIAYAMGNDLWVVNPKTGRTTRLFRGLFADKPGGAGYSEVAWTPDRHALVWTFHRVGKSSDTTDAGNELFTMRWDGTHKRRLTNSGYKLLSTFPHVSPDGKTVLYSRMTGDRRGGPGYTGTEIRVVNLDGTHDRRILGDVRDLENAETMPFWSLDGKHIVFKRYHGNLDYVFGYDLPAQWRTIALDGTDERNFDGQWALFDVPWQSRLAPSQFAPEASSFDVKPPYQTDSKPFSPLGEAFQISKWELSPSSAQVAFSASRPRLKGRYAGERERGLWISGFDGQNPRLIASGDAQNGPQLLGWL